KPLGDQLIPSWVVFNRKHRLHPISEEQRRTPGTIFANRHLGLEEFLEKIDRRVGEPGDFEVQWRLVIQNVVRNATGDVLGMERQVQDQATDFLRDVPTHSLLPASNRRLKREGRGGAGPFSLALGLGPIIGASSFEKAIRQPGRNE